MRRCPLLALREQVINPISTADGMAHYYLRAGRLDEAGNRMRDVTIYDVSNPDVSRTIYADSGRIAFDEQRVDAVPHVDYDERLDWVLTPSGPLRPLRRRR